MTAPRIMVALFGPPGQGSFNESGYDGAMRARAAGHAVEVHWIAPLAAHARAAALRGEPGPEDSHASAEILQAPPAQLLGRARIVDVGGDDERALPRCPTAITCDLQGGVSNPANDPRGEGRPHIVCSSRTLAFGSHPAAWPVS